MICDNQSPTKIESDRLPFPIQSCTQSFPHGRDGQSWDKSFGEKCWCWYCVCIGNGIGGIGIVSVLVLLLLLVLAPWIAESELREHSCTPSQLLGSGVHCVEHHWPEKIVAHTPSLNRGILLHENLEQKRVGSYEVTFPNLYFGSIQYS